MWPNPQDPADLVIFTEEILNYFLCSPNMVEVTKDLKMISRQVLGTINNGRILKAYVKYMIGEKQASCVVTPPFCLKTLNR